MSDVIRPYVDEKNGGFAKSRVSKIFSLPQFILPIAQIFRLIQQVCSSCFDPIRVLLSGKIGQRNETVYRRSDGDNYLLEV